MSLDKKKFKPQNLSGLIHDTDSSASQKDRESNSPAPGSRPATLTSASGTYQLSSAKDTRDWSSHSPEPTEPSAPEAPAAPKAEFDWGEEDDWTPETVAQPPVQAQTQTSQTQSSNPWGAKVTASKDLGSEIKRLKTTTHSAAAPKGPTKVAPKSWESRDGRDSLSRFRVDASEPRDLMDASRMHSEQRRPFERSFERQFDRPRGRFGQFEEEEEQLDWGRRGGSTHRGSHGASAGPASSASSAGGVPPTLRPLKSSITKSVPTGNEPTATATPAVTGATTTAAPAAVTAAAAPVDPKELLEHQKEEMHAARQKALEARIAKEKKEEEEKKQRLAARLAELDRKDREKRAKQAAEQAAEQRKRETANLKEQARQDAKTRREAERKEKEELKERLMADSWRSGKGKPLNSMRREREPREKDTREREPREREPREREARDSRKSAAAESITILLPELNNLMPLKAPASVVDKLPTHSWNRREDREEISILLPVL